MKIAFIVDYFPKISETFIMNQIIGLVDQGHEVRVFAHRRPDETLTHSQIEEYGLLDRTTYFESPNSYAAGFITTLRLALSHPKSLPEIGRSLIRGEEGGGRISRLLQFESYDKKDFDMYHAHFGAVAKQWDFLPVKTDIPFIASFYGSDASRELSKDPRTFKWLFETSSIVTVLSDDMRNDLINGGCPPHKIRTLPLPINVDRFQSSPSEPPSNGPTRILTIARFVEKKGLDDALDTIEEISEEHDVVWTIAGDGPLRETFEVTIRNKGLNNTVKILGWVTQDRVEELLKNAHIFLLPSKTSQTGDKEGTPTVLLEAQASGIPVLSTRHAGIPKIVKDGDAGILVPEGNPEELSNALRELLANPNRWEEMGEMGRSFVSSEHSIRSVADELEELYETAISSTD